MAKLSKGPPVPSAVLRLGHRFGHSSAPTLAIAFGRTHVVIAHGSVSREGIVTLRRRERWRLPGEFTFDDAENCGAWLGRQLSDAGFAGESAVMALPRRAVALKRFTLPTRDEDELPEMVRLAMLRELPLDAGEAIVDFAIDAHDDVSTTTIAAALPVRMLSHLSRIAEIAEIRVVRIAPRCAGIAALARAMPALPDQQHVFIDLSDDALELTERGIDGAWTTTASDLHPATGDDPRASLIAAAVLEAKRSWASRRFGAGEHDDAAHIHLIADEAIDVDAAARIGEAIGVNTAPLRDHPSVRVQVNPHSTVDEENADTGTPSLALAGVLLESAGFDGRGVNFAAPRRTPDRAARRRQLVIAGVGGVALALVGGWTIGRGEAMRESELRAEVIDKARLAAPEGRRARRDEDKLAHLEEWGQLRQDWVADLLHVRGLMPDPGDVVIDSITATEEFKGVQWHEKKGWSSSAEIRIVLEGEAKTRAIADALRDRLVKDESFVVTTSGSDTRGGNRLPYPFGYLMKSVRSTAAPPDKATDKSPAKPDAKSDESATDPSSADPATKSAEGGS